jgi:uncharacterized membrane protein
MSNFDSDEDMSTPITQLKNKKLVSNTINKPPPKIVYVKKNTKSSNKNFYINLIIFSLLFFMVNNYELNNYLVSKKFGYNIIIFIKLVLFLVLYYFYQYLIK